MYEHQHVCMCVTQDFSTVAGNLPNSASFFVFLTDFGCCRTPARDLILATRGGSKLPAYIIPRWL